ncbi:MAG: C10 family peptidase [Muribaculaceae bacterium]|nr:C10 family peptidase [Muribaculaceae bacterium]
MKRILLSFMALAMVCGVQAKQVNESAARQTAAKFFAEKATRFAAPSSSSTLQLAYTAEKGRFYIYNRGAGGGYVIVAGDDELPQVLGYGTTGSFTSSDIPLPMQDWMAEMNREIAYFQSHPETPVHHPVKRATAVGPLLTTRWNQDWPYNNMCPTYSNGEARAVTGCVATAMAQIMKYHEWPIQGTGSHSYYCEVNGTDPITLSADFSQSVYQWDLMLDTYDATSSEESCDAVAKLMSDAGISVDMNYGNSSGAQETDALAALTEYFGYSNRSYLLQRDLFGAKEWDRLLVDELDARRPMLYCGFTYTQGSLGGHAFVFDGYNTDGYFHVNWGWGGAYDNYFLVSLLAPSSGNNFKYGQDCIFGIIPAPQADEVAGVLYLRGVMHPNMQSVPRGNEVNIRFSDLIVQGNLLDTAGVEHMGNWNMPYDMIPVEVAVYDQNGVKRQSHKISYKVFISSWWSRTEDILFTPDASLEEGEYVIKVAYSPLKNDNYDSWISNQHGQPVYCKMRLTDDMVYLSDCSLAETYDLDLLSTDTDIYVNEPFNVNVKLAYNGNGYGPGQGQTPNQTTGNVHLSLLDKGIEVAASDPVPVSIAYNSSESYTLQMTAPAQWGRYQLVVVDDSGQPFTPRSGWYDLEEPDGSINIFVLPVSDKLVEDFEAMEANSSTNQTNVQGVFTKWNFNKSGVRAPGEGKCNGIHSVMMKKPSTFYSVEPLNHHFLMASAIFFNNASTDAKYTLEYSVDNGATWVKAPTMEDELAAIVPGSSIVDVIWKLNLKSSDAALFRVSMTGGGSAATYIDDFTLHYKDIIVAGDVNLDGETNIADVNAVIDIILGGASHAEADVNGDGEINVADVNAVINIIQGS